MLGLPVPAFGMSVSEDGTGFFSSLDFNFDRDELPPVEPDCCWKYLPFLTTGIVLFDVLIANSDRHDNNLAADRVTKPTAIQVFDHDQALLGGGDPSLKGVARLDKMVDRLGITSGNVSRGNRHCLLDAIESAEHIREWTYRIGAIPDWFIKEVCQEACRYGVTRKEGKQIQSFLSQRRNSFATLIEKHRAEFRGIKQWKLPNALF